MKRIALTITCIGMFAGAAGAADTWLLARPGMVAADHLESWNSRCQQFVLTENEGEENYLTCILEQGAAVTANVTPDGLVWWSRFWGAGHLSRADFVTHFANELGLEGAPVECRYFDDAAQCWNVGSAVVTIPEDREGDGWAVTMEE